MSQRLASLRRPLAIVALVATPVVFLAMGCAPSAPHAAQPGTAVVIFVDFSASVVGADRAAFKREIETQVLPWLDAGDKILIAPIHDKTLTEFRPFVEATLPARHQFNGWFDNVMKHNRQSKEVEAKLVQVKETVKTQASDGLTRRYSAQYTDIFSSLIIAEKLFAGESRRKVLIIMSDMIEDSPTHKFDRMTWTPNTTQKLIAELDAKRMIADLTGVCVYVAGASAPSAELAQDIGRFWQTYFRKARADLEPSRYSRVLLHWPPPTSCRFR